MEQVKIGHFRRLSHAEKRCNNADLLLPKLGTGSRRRDICYGGTKIFNALPLHIYIEKYYIKFKSALKEHVKVQTLMGTMNNL